jgi:hypothetical protein
MPLQGQWERQQAPLGSRERRTIAIVGGVLALALAIVLYFSVVKSGSAGVGCVNVTVPSTMGAASMHACGDRARSLCASQSGGDQSDPFVRAAEAACRKAGFAG